MAQRRAFLVRIDPLVLDAVQRWANDNLRSLNGQIEFVLRQALVRAGRGVERDGKTDTPPASGDSVFGADS